MQGEPGLSADSIAERSSMAPDSLVTPSHGSQNAGRDQRFYDGWLLAAEAPFVALMLMCVLFVLVL